MTRDWRWAVVGLFVCALAGLALAEDAVPIKALLITGGGYHDYKGQEKLLTEGISARINIQWTVEHPLVNGKEQPGQAMMDIYKKPDWAKGYDVIVHNECHAEVTDKAFVEGVVKAHTEGGVPAVVIHATMHTYRDADKVTDEWRKLLGVTSHRHEAGGATLEVKTVKADHPIMMGLPEGLKDLKAELYVIDKEWPECVPLATCKSKENAAKEYTTIWVNTYGKTKVFGTTLGHDNSWFQTPASLDVMARGILWTCGKLDEKGQPKAGYGPKPK
jgi:uncharacterized protein